MASAFRILPLRPEVYYLLIMKAKHPVTGMTYYFVEKNLSFGASISCSHFQRFSLSLKHIFEFLTDTTMVCTAYLDDYLFLAPSQVICDQRVREFLTLCSKIGVPTALEKTEWGREVITFLGVNLNGTRRILTIPDDKQIKAIRWISYINRKKKGTVKELEQLTGLLNFLGRAIVPGKAFTCRMYAKFTGAKEIGLRAYHHVTLDREFKNDCDVWLKFLTSNDKSISKPFINFTDLDETSEVLSMYSDATAHRDLGFGIIFDSKWMLQQWEPRFIEQYEPSIEFLELYALCVGVFTWSERLKNRRFITYCDNESACNMVRNTSCGCKFCMTLIRKLVLRSLKFNFRVFPRHIKGKDNYLSDSLSRLNREKFWRLARKDGLLMDPNPTILNIPDLWPLSKYWITNCAKL